MDNFDLRKFITEGKLAESKKAHIQFEDGSTETRTVHQSVSDDKIKAMYGPGNVLDGRTVAKVVVGDSLDKEGLEEASMRDKVDGLLAYYEAEMGEPADDGMEREIKSLIANGKSTDDVKSIIINRDTINEQEDVLEPQDVPEKEPEQDTEEKEEETDKLPEIDKKFISSVESKLAKNISSNIKEVNDEYIDKKMLADAIRIVKNAKEWKQFFVQDNLDDYENLDVDDVKDSDYINELYKDYISNIVSVYTKNSLFKEILDNEDIYPMDVLFANLSDLLEDEEFMNFNRGSYLYNENLINSYRRSLSNMKNGKFSNLSFDPSSLSYTVNNG